MGGAYVPEEPSECAKSTRFFRAPSSCALFITRSDTHDGGASQRNFQPHNPQRREVEHQITLDADGNVAAVSDKLRNFVTHACAHLPPLQRERS